MKFLLDLGVAYPQSFSILFWIIVLSVGFLIRSLYLKYQDYRQQNKLLKVAKDLINIDYHILKCEKSLNELNNLKIQNATTESLIYSMNNTIKMLNKLKYRGKN